MGVAALISWLVTALFGLYLLAVWLIENDVTQRGATASRLPAPVIFGHVLLALTGLVFWVIHLLSGSTAGGWATVGILGGVATLGLTMFTRWIPVHVAHVAAEAKAGRPAEVRLPGRTGLSGVGRRRSRPARRHHAHPGSAHHAYRLTSSRPGGSPSVHA
jgi:hypothetical protein